MNIRYLNKILLVPVLFFVAVFASTVIHAHEGKDHNVVPKSAPSNSSSKENSPRHGDAPNSQGNQKYVAIANGERVKISIKDICEELIENCKVKNLSIFKDPAEGILFPQDAEGNANYQHAGTSKKTDEIVFSYAESDTDIGRKFSIIFEVIKTPAKYVFLSPASDFKTTDRYVTVQYEVSGDTFGHVHMSLNGGKQHISVYDKMGSYTFKELPIGENRIEVTLARTDHRNIPGTMRSITFEVIHK